MREVCLRLVTLGLVVKLWIFQHSRCTSVKDLRNHFSSKLFIWQERYLLNLLLASQMCAATLCIAYSHLCLVDFRTLLVRRTCMSLHRISALLAYKVRYKTGLLCWVVVSFHRTTYKNYPSLLNSTVSMCSIVDGVGCACFHRRPTLITAVMLMFSWMLRTTQSRTTFTYRRERFARSKKARRL